MNKPLLLAAFGLISVMVLGGCASTVPLEIRVPPEGEPSLGAVQQDAEALQGRAVRWGGTIAAVENRAEETELEIVARELGAEGRPKAGDQTYGRFLARVSGFLDPAVYHENRAVTVAGVVDSRVTRMIGDRPYTYPVIVAKTVYLWQDYSELYRYYPYHPYRYDPFWYRYPYPYRYYYPYPYRYRFGLHYGF